jgi:hypothetical protein
LGRKETQTIPMQAPLSKAAIAECGQSNKLRLYPSRLSLVTKSINMKRLLSVCTAVLVTAIVYAQKTDFSGTWTLKDQRSISGTLYSNGVPKQIKVTQTNDALMLETTTANAQGQDVTTVEDLAFNGEKFETTTASKRKKSVALNWDKDGKTFTHTADLSQIADTSKVEIRYTDTWRVEDGKLILLRKAENFSNGEGWESKSIYQKQQFAK